MKQKIDLLYLPEELHSLIPFYHDVDLGGGLNTAPQSRRIRNAIELFFPGLVQLCGGSLNGKRVLDVGCNCGGFSFAAARFGAHEIIGIDSRKIHIDQANAIRSYLKMEQTKFICADIEDMSLEKLGEFDICLLAGIIYHLQNPIGVMKKLSKATSYLLMIDSHVHYSTDAALEDIPTWWMLNDTDRGSVDGLFINHKNLNEKNLRRFEEEYDVDYSTLPNQFVGSPHSIWEQKFSMQFNPEPPRSTPTPDGVSATDVGSLVLVPNKKALFNLVRHIGFEDILEVIPHRFSEVRYLRRYRIGFFAIRRKEGGHFPISECQRMIKR